MDMNSRNAHAFGLGESEIDIFCKVGYHYNTGATVSVTGDYSSGWGASNRTIQGYQYNTNAAVSLPGDYSSGWGANRTIQGDFIRTYTYDETKYLFPELEESHTALQDGARQSFVRYRCESFVEYEAGDNTGEYNAGSKKIVSALVPVIM